VRDFLDLQLSSSIYCFVRVYLENLHILV
jgi:hypothetical protein